MFIQRYVGIQMEKANRTRADGNYTGIFDKISKLGTFCQNNTAFL